MLVGVEDVALEAVALLADGPATVPQLATAMGVPERDVERALVWLFARFRVEPATGGWRLASAPLVTP